MDHIPRIFKKFPNWVDNPPVEYGPPSRPQDGQECAVDHAAEDSLRGLMIADSSQNQKRAFVE